MRSQAGLFPRDRGGGLPKVVERHADAVARGSGSSGCTCGSRSPPRGACPSGGPAGGRSRASMRSRFRRFVSSRDAPGGVRRNAKRDSCGSATIVMPGIVAHGLGGLPREVELLVERRAEGREAAQLEREPHGEARGSCARARARSRRSRRSRRRPACRACSGRGRCASAGARPGSFTRRQPEPYGMKRPLCGSRTIESARARPASAARPRSVSAKNPPYAASVWSQRPSFAAKSASASRSSTAPVFVVPALATTRNGVKPARAIPRDALREGVEPDPERARRTGSRARSRRGSPRGARPCGCSGGPGRTRRACPSGSSRAASRAAPRRRRRSSRASRRTSGIRRRSPGSPRRARTSG